MSFPRVQTCRGELRIHDNLDDLSTDLVEYISEISDVSVKERGVFTIALSGGSLIGLLRKLCDAPYSKTIDWAKWYIFWVDERVVAKSHADSNYKLAKDRLLTKVPVISSHLHSINDALSAEEAAAEYEFEIRQLVKSRLINVCDITDCPKFDLILLGMGPDGHVASLFPKHSALDVKDEWITFITDSPKPPPERITFTMPVINSASNVAVVAIGASKADAMRVALDTGDVKPDSLALPARMVQPTQGNLVWFADQQAALKLDVVEFSE